MCEEEYKAKNLFGINGIKDKFLILYEVNKIRKSQITNEQKN